MNSSRWGELISVLLATISYLLSQIFFGEEILIRQDKVLICYVAIAHVLCPVILVLLFIK